MPPQPDPVRLLEPSDLPPPLGRYLGMMRATLRQPAAADNSGLRHVEALTRAVAAVDGQEEQISPDAAKRRRSSDSHQIPRPRAFYGPLDEYAKALARWLTGAAQDAGGAAPEPPAGTGAFDPARGPEVCRWAWSTLALIAGQLGCGQATTNPSDAARFLERLRGASRQEPGLFRTLPSPGEEQSGPESRWYHELVLLHAVTSAAILTNDSELRGVSERAAAYHHSETQPDHATSQPWALHAFLRRTEYLPTADLLLLAARVNEPGALGAVPRVLIADAVVCLSIPAG